VTTAFRLGELAAAVGGEVVGDPGFEARGIRDLEHAGPGDLSFLLRAAYLDRLEGSRAGALLLSPELARGLGGERPLLLAPDPGLALAHLLAIVHPEESPVPGVHPTAVVGEGCDVDPAAHLGPYVVVGDGSRVEAGASVRSHAVIGRRCRIGAGAVIHPHAVLYDRTEVGERAIVHAGVVLGADGFGYESRADGHHKVPQVGRTVVEEEVEIGALSAIDRATVEETRIGAGTKIDNLVQVGHNVTVGNRCILCGQAGIAGSARLGDGVVLAGQAGISGHLEVASGVRVAAKSAVLQEVGESRDVGGVPAIDLRRWKRQVAMLPRLGELARRLRALEKRLERMERREE
jgi:UDP-3-O-[3-hydroxymyristoyl] glucosamine N-acyltransferase